jgi:hypothetical protein
MTVTAQEAGEALSTVAIKLLEANIVAQEGFSVLTRVAGDVRRRKSELSWSIEVDRGQPISFNKVLDRSGIKITPKVMAKGITVSQGERHTPPFDHLDMSLEIANENDLPVARWHLDLANRRSDHEFQSGPLIHLQYGGHFHDDPSKDEPLKSPRWCHPPMEIGLLCEVVAANFYEAEWAGLRDDPAWCRAIGICQRLCYSVYVEKLAGSLSVSSSTALNVMWASSWGVPRG